MTVPSSWLLLLTPHGVNPPLPDATDVCLWLRCVYSVLSGGSHVASQGFFFFWVSSVCACLIIKEFSDRIRKPKTNQQTAKISGSCRSGPRHSRADQPPHKTTSVSTSRDRTHCCTNTRYNIVRLVTFSQVSCVNSLMRSKPVWLHLYGRVISYHPPHGENSSECIKIPKFC